MASVVPAPPRHPPPPRFLMLADTSDKQTGSLVYRCCELQSLSVSLEISGWTYSWWNLFRMLIVWSHAKRSRTVWWNRMIPSKTTLLNPLTSHNTRLIDIPPHPLPPRSMMCCSRLLRRWLTVTLLLPSCRILNGTKWHFLWFPSNGQMPGRRPSKTSGWQSALRMVLSPPCYCIT